MNESRYSNLDLDKLLEKARVERGIRANGLKCTSRRCGSSSTMRQITIEALAGMAKKAITGHY